MSGNKLSDKAIKNAAIPTAEEGPYKMADGFGLTLEVRPSGAKRFLYRYRIGGKANGIVLGDYPAMSLTDARAKRDEYIALVAKQQHPGQVKRAAEAKQIVANAETFGALAVDFLAWKRTVVKAKTAAKIEACLNNNILPVLRKHLVRDITTEQIVALIQAKRATPSMGQAVRGVVNEMFNFAITAIPSRASVNPCAPLKGMIGERGKVLVKPAPVNNPWLHLKDVAAFVRAIDAAEGSSDEIRIGTKLLMLTMVRADELSAAPWAEFDLDAAVWNIPAERMKMQRPHIVPLSTQAVALLRELHKLTGDTPVLFPERSPKGKARKALRASGAVLTKASKQFLNFINSIGYEGKLTAHGLRATASTALNEEMLDDERPRFLPPWVEMQLAHAKGKRGDAIALTYNHAQYLPQRTKMIQWWADACLPVQATNVIPLRKAA